MACLVIAVIISSALLATGPAFMNPAGFLPTLQRVVALAALIGLILWRPGLGHPIALRLATVLIGITFLVVAWDAIRVLNHTTMTLAFPLADDLLDGWDRALGLDWRSYFLAVEANPTLRAAMAWSYNSLTYLSVIAYLMMCVDRDYRRSLYFLETFTLTAVVCTVSGAFFPARAAVDRYFGSDADLSVFPVEPGLYHLGALEKLRSGAPVELVLGQLPGLVTFPSFHTAAGILLVAAAWRSWLFLPALAYSTLMIASTPVYGGHYFIDLLSGALIAVGIALIWARFDRFRPVFQGRRDG